MPTPRQRAARLDARTVRARTPDPDGAEARIAAYIPGDPAADPHLPLIRDLARRARPVDASDAAEILTVLAGHAAALSAQGIPVAEQTVLCPDRVRRWLLLGLAGLSAGTTANYRSRLDRVRAAVLGEQPRRDPMHASSPVDAYRPAEEDRLVRWAGGQPDGSLRDDLTAAAAVLLGTGASAAEAKTARGADVVRAHGGLALDIRGDRPRLVPVRDRYAPLLAAAAERVGPDRHLVMPGAPGRGGRNGLSNLVDRALATSGTRGLRLTPQRTRATWVVRQLEAGTRADLLVAAAGVDSLAALARYVPQMRPPAAGTIASLRLAGDSA